MRTRHEFMLAIQQAIAPAGSAEEKRAAIEALLCIAATIAHAMCGNSKSYSEAHVRESAEAMLAILDETFS